MRLIIDLSIGCAEGYQWSHQLMRPGTAARIRCKNSIQRGAKMSYNLSDSTRNNRYTKISLKYYFSVNSCFIETELFQCSNSVLFLA